MLELIWKILIVTWIMIVCCIVSADSTKIAKLEQKVEILSKVALVSVMQNASSAEAK